MRLSPTVSANKTSICAADARNRLNVSLKTRTSRRVKSFVLIFNRDWCFNRLLFACGITNNSRNPMTVNTNIPCVINPNCGVPIINKTKTIGKTQRKICLIDTPNTVIPPIKSQVAAFV